MHTTKWCLVLLVAMTASVNVLSAEAARAASPPALSASSSSGDCDDTSATCTPAADLHGAGALDSTSAVDSTVSGAAVSGSSSSSSSSSVSSQGQACVDGACVSPVTAQPSGMAINEKGLPGEKKPKSTK